MGPQFKKGLVVVPLVCGICFIAHMPKKCIIGFWKPQHHHTDAWCGAVISLHSHRHRLQCMCAQISVHAQRTS